MAEHDPRSCVHTRDPLPARAWRSLVGIGALVAVVALLAGACSSGSDSSSAKFESVGGAIDDDGSSSGGGWSDCAPPCSFEGDPPNAAYETSSGDSGAPSTTGVTRSEAAVDDASRAPVTAGSVDDNADWDAYLRYRQEFDAKGIPVDRVTVEGRQVFTVVDDADKPVLGAEVVVRDDAGEVVASLKTYADGRALFHPPTTVDPNSQQRPRYTATVTKGTASQDVELTAETRSYDVRLAASGSDQVALDVVFLIDTTGSMGDEIDRLKANIASMAEKISALPVTPDVRYGMTLYRDRGDLFVTRTFDLTSDQEAFAAALAEVQADGGGDTPEDLDAGLRDAIDEQSWRGDDAVKLIFVVADAPPHLDDVDSVSYATSVIDAASQGIKILPIGASGLDPQGEYVFRQLAQITLGRFVFLTYGADGAGPGETTSMEVERDQYSVLPLDELVVRLVADELEPLGR